jgi:archaemetzincin
MRLLIIGLAYTHLDDLLWVKEALSKVFTNVKLLATTTQLQPDIRWYDWGRMQYRSELIVKALQELKELYGVDVVLAIADLDAYANGLNFVFGEAVLGSGVAVVYTRRLRPEFYGDYSPDSYRKYLSRLFKEVLHELGHALGLHHCNVPGCVMNFSNSVYEVDSKQPRYCSKCATKLRNLGVNVASSYELKL